ncbi:hypothetical protein ALC60_00820 [Trachymyrmex zeteki]|uniref:Uncharacterized protein n=1 Tax=Mycetomoellerius zeteki TaxID=64791 RepID=A0A151XJ24_9HYME|nr:hypothetical protein ALC60_00820 [Trachymyrmex zeteki]
MTRGVNNYPLTSITVTFDNRHRAVNAVNGKTAALRTGKRPTDKTSQRDTHGTPDPALPSPSLSINPRFASVSLTRVQHSRTARHSPSYPSHGCPPRVHAYPERGSRVNTDGSFEKHSLISQFVKFFALIELINIMRNKLKNMERQIRQLKKLKNIKKQIKEVKEKQKSLRRQIDVLLNDKITDVLNRLMHTFELLENNQIHYHNLTINDVTISAQINQLQAGAVNILQKINERFA